MVSLKTCLTPAFTSPQVPAHLLDLYPLILRLRQVVLGVLARHHKRHADQTTITTAAAAVPRHIHAHRRCHGNLLTIFSILVSLRGGGKNKYVQELNHNTIDDSETESAWGGRRLERGGQKKSNRSMRLRYRRPHHCFCDSLSWGAYGAFTVAYQDI